MEIKAIIIDDERDSSDAIKLILEEYCKNVEITGVANSAAEGIKLIGEKNPDLVFLDVEMPHMNGFQLLESIKDRKFDVIFITAYNHYAVKAFKVCAIDYILKPVDVNELVTAVKKAEEYKSKQAKEYPQYEKLIETLNNVVPEKIALPASDGIQYVNRQEVIRIEADGSYAKVFLTNKRILHISKNLSQLEPLFNKKTFYRAHKSHIINLEHVAKYSFKDGGFVEMSDGSSVSISRRNKNEFVEAMAKLSV
ncbi:MAG: LytTR family DNA-binding domain-containing protein [Bacteroidales bacterium]|nr:LytTR family DNA-binding domain-containing protein [Bacteroidales bacterium]